MSKEDYTPDVVDFAYQIIAMHEENEHLRQQLDHYKELHRIHLEGAKKSMDNSKNLIGTMLSAVLDPESAINKGYSALEREEQKTT